MRFGEFSFGDVDEYPDRPGSRIFGVDQISDRVNPYRPSILMTQLEFVVEGLSGTQGRSGKLASAA